MGSLGIFAHLAPGEEKEFEFFLGWHFPNRVKCWDGYQDKPSTLIEKNYYATLFLDAWDAAAYTANQLARLEGATRDFHRAFFGSTLPQEVLEAVSCNITQIRSNTCYRIGDGTFLGWEGVPHTRREAALAPAHMSGIMLKQLPSCFRSWTQRAKGRAEPGDRRKRVDGL